MVSAAKRNRRRARREHQVDPDEEEDTEVAFWLIVRPETDPTRDSPPAPQLVSPGSPASSAETQCGAVMDMVRKLDSEMSSIRTVYERLLCDNRD